MSLAQGSVVAERASTASQRAWPAAAWVCVAAVVALLAVYAQTVAGLLDNWLNSSAYGHALLILPICVWLVWRDRVVIAEAGARPQWLALLVVPVGTVGWLLGDLLSIRVGRELSLYLMLVGVIWTTLGTRVVWRLAFPLGYLLLTIPVWSMLIPPLQDATAMVSARSLQMLGVPVYLEGHYMHIPHGQFVVEEVCAGLRFLLATMAIIALHARLSLYSPSRGWLLFAAAVVSAIVFNWLRVDIIVLAGHLGGMQHPLVTNHIAFGWVMFIVSLGPVMLLSRWLQRGDLPPAPSQAAGSAQGQTGLPASNAVAAALALLLALPGVGVSAMLASNSVRPASADLGVFPSLAGLTGPVVARSGLDPQFATADAQTEQRYMLADGQTAAVYVAYYATQGEGAELVSDINRLYGKGWSGSGAAVIPTGGADGLPARVVETLARSSTGDTRLIWYWYYSGGRFTTSRLHAKLLQVLDIPLLREHPRGAAMIAVSIPATSTASAEARLALAQVAAPLLPQLKERLAEVDTAP